MAELTSSTREAARRLGVSDTTMHKAERTGRIAHLEDVLRCTFFDWDAAAYDLRTRRVMCSDDYLERLRLGVLDINLLESPSPKGNLLRAIRRLALWRARPGPALRAFIEQHLNEASFRELQAYERQQRHPDRADASYPIRK
jgi:hypothetical protein